MCGPSIRMPLHSPGPELGHVQTLRGGSEALHSRDFDPVEKRLVDLEMLFKQGHLSQTEMESERQRILLSTAESNLDLHQDAGENDPELLNTMNATIARRANNNLARMLAERPQEIEAADGSAGWC